MLVQDETLLITTRDKVRDVVEPRVYDVYDLVNRDSATGNHDATVLDFDCLIDSITKIIDAPDWNQTIEPISDGSLVVCQTAEVQEQISQLLVAIRKARDQAKAGNYGEVPIEPVRPTEAAIHSALAKKGDFTFDNLPLDALPEKIHEHYGIASQFDVFALKDASIDPKSTVVRQQVRGITLRSALNRCLSGYGLTWLVQNEILLITTNDKAGSVLNVRLYPIGDLIERADAGNEPNSSPVDNAMEYVRIIASTVDPTTWAQASGRGAISIDESGTTMIVSQVQTVHEKIATFLAECRDARKHRLQVAEKGLAKSESQDALVIRVYELQTATPATPTMSPQEVADVVQGLIQPNSWSQPEIYIRGVTGKLIVRQTPGVQRKSKNCYTN